MTEEWPYFTVPNYNKHKEFTLDGQYCLWNLCCPPPCRYRELKQQRRWRHRERQKINRFRLAKQQLCTCITLFCTFPCRHYTTTTWNCLISRFVEDANTRQRFSFCFSWTSMSPLKWNSRKIRQHSSNRRKRNKCDEVWSSANSLFKWRFCNRRRLCCLSSLLARQRSTSPCDAFCMRAHLSCVI